MKIMSDKKFNELIENKEKEYLDHIDNLRSDYQVFIDAVCDANLKLKVENGNLKKELNDIDSNKVRYLKMIENKSFKTKRLNKKYKYKLLREIELLFKGGNIKNEEN